MKLIYSVFILAVLTFSGAKAQTPALRGIYIDSFSQILGNTAKEDSLLHYAQDSSFNYLAFYDLQNVSFTSSTSVNKLASFIRNARENYGIQYIGAVCESYSSFTSKIVPYNNGRTNVNEKFNVFNMEFEFWISSSVTSGGYYCTQYLNPNGCNCDTSGAFKYYIDQIHKIDSLAATQNALSETYVGWFNQGQGQQIAQNVDRILVHAYRTDASSVYGYSKTRLSYLASLSQQVDVVPIFSSEPDFMGPWLNSHSMTEAYSKYLADFNADNSSWKPYIRLLGYQWFDYGFMPKPIPGAATTFNPSITTSGTTSFCSGGSVTLTATSGSAYLWSNGQTTRSITVSSSGSYSCNVTQNGSSVNTSSVNVNSNALPTSAFVISNSVVGNVTLSSNSSAGSGSVSSYQWYYNGNAIGSANASTYNASSSGSYTLTTINSNGCSQTSSSQSIVVPAGACVLTSPDGCSSSNLSSTTVVLQWNNLPSCDSVIVRYKKESSSVYTYVRLRYNGNNMIAISNITPNTQYSWRVKTTCGTQYSNYSTKKYFTTHGPIASVAYSPAARTTEMPVTIQEVNKELVIFPNPVKDKLRINFSSEVENQGDITLMDLTGRVLLSMPVSVIEGENSFEINTSSLPSGIYIAGIKSQAIHQNKRIIIQN